ncbi:NADP:D-xylose dehydrogenase [Paramyrothecium foliicola]|nr:NADP:D-xylose dehydrogenase [Paramyrothecium foliicola]
MRNEAYSLIAFCKDILIPPPTRGVTDVTHSVVAVASRSIGNARAFADKLDSSSNIRAYGSYIDLVNDKDVDVVYIGTPNSHHFQNAMLALHAGKHVLCEKPLTVTVEQAHCLAESARQKGLFLMEAVWTRFQPLNKKVCELIAAGEIGTVSRVTADVSFNNTVDGGSELEFPDSHRKVNLDLAGGAMLNFGVYGLTWIFQILYHLQPASKKDKPVTLAAVNKYRTGIDDSVAVMCHFRASSAVGVCTTSLRTATDTAKENNAVAIRIHGSKGEIAIQHPAYRPEGFTIIQQGGATTGFSAATLNEEAGKQTGDGFFWEADEVARCIRDGKTESTVVPLEESLAIMEVMSETLRQGGVVYPSPITNAVFNVEDPLNAGQA